MDLVAFIFSMVKVRVKDSGVRSVDKRKQIMTTPTIGTLERINDIQEHREFLSVAINGADPGVASLQWTIFHP